MKEFLYIGHYEDINGNYILKVGTTKNLKKRLAEHNIYYPKAERNPMRQGTVFKYDWYIKLSHDNTLKYESEFKHMMKLAEVADYVRNDRFIFKRKPQKIYITVRKTYEVKL